MAGLRPTEVEEMIAIIKGIRDGGVTIFVIEHIIRAIMALSDRIAVIHFGKKITEGIDIKIIDIYYGDVQVVYGVSLHIDEGEIISIIGANGAGKSTILKCISGLINTKSGEMYFNNEPIQNIPPEQVVDKGIIAYQ